MIMRLRSDPANHKWNEYRQIYDIPPIDDCEALGTHYDARTQTPGGARTDQVDDAQVPSIEQGRLSQRHCQKDRLHTEERSGHHGRNGDQRFSSSDEERPRRARPGFVCDYAVAIFTFRRKLVARTRIELVTRGFSVRCSTN